MWKTQAVLVAASLAFLAVVSNNEQVTMPECCIGPNGECSPPAPIFPSYCPSDWTPIFDQAQCPNPCTIDIPTPTPTPTPVPYVYHPVWGAGVLVADQPQVHPPDLVWLHGTDYSIAVDRNKGGAVVSILYDGLEMLSNFGAGDQWQTAIHYYDGQKWSNPTQAGVSVMDPWIPSEIRLFWTDGRALEVLVNPMEWESALWGNVRWVEMLMGYRIDVDYAGVAGLIRHESIIYLPHQMPSGEHAQWWNMAHTNAVLEHFFRYDENEQYLVPQNAAITPPFWFPHTTVIDTRQSAVVSDGLAHAFSLMAYHPQWDRTQMSYHYRGGNSTTRLGVALANRELPAGWNRLVSYWWIGSLPGTKPVLDRLWYHMRDGNVLGAPCTVRQVMRRVQR